MSGDAHSSTLRPSECSLLWWRKCNFMRRLAPPTFILLRTSNATTRIAVSTPASPQMPSFAALTVRYTLLPPVYHAPPTTSLAVEVSCRNDLMRPNPQPRGRVSSEVILSDGDCCSHVDLFTPVIDYDITHILLGHPSPRRPSRRLTIMGVSFVTPPTFIP